MLTWYVLFRSAGRSLRRSCYCQLSRRHGVRRQNASSKGIRAVVDIQEERQCKEERRSN